MSTSLAPFESGSSVPQIGMENRPQTDLFFKWQLLSTCGRFHDLLFFLVPANWPIVFLYRRILKWTISKCLGGLVPLSISILIRPNTEERTWKRSLLRAVLRIFRNIENSNGVVCISGVWSHWLKRNKFTHSFAKRTWSRGTLWRSPARRGSNSL